MKKTYTQSAEEVLRDLGTGAEGLTTQQAQERLAKYGPNRLKEAEKPTLFQRFLAQLKDPMLIILMIAAGVSALTTLLLEVPFLANAFGFEMISWTEYAIAIGLAFLVIPVVEFVKFIQRRIAGRHL